MVSAGEALALPLAVALSLSLGPTLVLSVSLALVLTLSLTLILALRLSLVLSLRLCDFCRCLRCWRSATATRFASACRTCTLPLALPLP